MKKFEYKTVRIEPKSFWNPKIDHEEVDHMLNENGRQGWELVSVIDTEYGGSTWSFHYTFKREL